MVNLSITLREKLLYPANYSSHGLDLFEEKPTSFKINTNFAGETGGGREKKENEKLKTWSKPSDGAPACDGHALQLGHPTASIRLWEAAAHLQQLPPSRSSLAQSRLQQGDADASPGWVSQPPQRRLQQCQDLSQFGRLLLPPCGSCHRG